MIELHPEKKMPLYEQLYNALAQDIRSGALQPGKALPGRRTMAAQLGISTNTVDTAYQMLAAEGLAVTRPRSGFFVQETGGMLHTRPQHSVVPAPKATPKNTVSNQDDILYDLSTGSIDTSLFPARSWGRIQKELMYQRPELLQRGDMQGDENLRAQIAAYLGEYRGVDCTADQVVVGAGVEYLLGCLAHLFAGSTAAVENPGYSRTRAVLENNGIPCVPVEIDESGLPIRALEQSGANLCYVTPSHHFPTGVTMPAPRRAQLLGWAAAKPGRFILEDDYDSEFRFATRPLPSLQGMSGANGPVVYLTTFSKSLAPGMRIACMVLPQGLLERYQSDFSMYANTVSRYEQQTLCEFMANGYFARHIARMRLTYKRRMEAFAAALHAGLDPDLTLTGAHSGLHFLLTLPGAGGEQAMVQAAAKQGVRLKGLSEYYMQDAAHCRPDTVVAGYSRRGGRVEPGVAANVTLHHLIGTIQCRPVRGRRPLQIIDSHIINFARAIQPSYGGVR